jgi:hypothetical protein
MPRHFCSVERANPKISHRGIAATNVEGEPPGEPWIYGSAARSTGSGSRAESRESLALQKIVANMYDPTRY